MKIFYIGKGVFYMIQSVSLNEVGNFLDLIVRGFDDYLYLAFVMMIVFNIAIFLKYLVSGVR